MPMRGNHSLRGRRAPRRANIACLSCRHRKVRCDLWMQEASCTNCRLDRCECITRPRSSRYPKDPGGAARHASQDGSMISMERNSWTGPSAYSHPGLDYMEMYNPDPPMAGALLPPAEHSRLNIDGSVSYTLLSFSYYPYLQAPNLWRLQAPDMAFLESQNSLHIPAGPFLDTLIAHYFLYVHPCFPIINEAEFWPMFRERVCEASSFSLLVFQAMLFVATSYISLNEAKKWGAKSIVALRHSFYRRAKLLYDFGVEEDPLRLSQALGLLTYHSSSTDHLSNSNTLSLAIQYARAANAHLYYRYPRRSDLKRLWWCLILRDRIIALGMRRPIQILPTHFDTSSRTSLVMEDLKEENETSEVYDSKTKIALCKTLTSQCELAAALTTLIMTVYPVDAFYGQNEDLAPESFQVEDIKARLCYWQTKHMLQLSAQVSEAHSSATFYKQLTTLYYECARLTLHHHISFWLYKRQRSDNRPDLMDATSAISDKVKRFVIDGTAGLLPISVVAYTVLPQILLNFHLRVTKTKRAQSRQSHLLKIYNELNHLYRLRYDVSHVASWIEQILRRIDEPISCSAVHSMDGIESGSLVRENGLSDWLGSQPALYFHLADIIDSSMSTGHLPVERLDSLMDFLSGKSPRGLETPLHPKFSVGPSRFLVEDDSQAATYVPTNTALVGHEKATDIPDMTISMGGAFPLQNSTMLSVEDMGTSDDITPGTHAALTTGRNPVLDVPEYGQDSQVIINDPASVDTLWAKLALFGE